jgi:hypothetical protein
MRVTVGSARLEQPRSAARDRARSPRLQGGAALSPERAIALQRAAGNAAVAGIHQRLLRVSKLRSATLDGVQRDWKWLLTTYRAAAPGSGGAAPALGALDFTQPIVIPEPKSRAQWINAWRTIWLIVAEFKREVANRERPLPKLRQALGTADESVAESNRIRKMLADYEGTLSQGKLPEDISKAYRGTQLWDKLLEPNYASYAADPGKWRTFSTGRLSAEDKALAKHTTSQSAAQQALAAAMQPVEAIRKATPLVEMTVCNHVVKVDRGLRESAGATTAGWVAVDDLTVEQMKYHKLAEKLTQEQGELERKGLSSQAALAQQAARIRAIVDGQSPAAATAAEVSIAAVWFGPEFMRNADSFGMGLMMLELMERGATYGAHNKPYTWHNVLSGTLHAGESIEQWRLRKDPHGTLDAGPIETVDQWSGKFPMALKGSEALGSKPLGALPNIVQAKEASLLIHWMQARNITTSAGLAQQLAAL